MYWLLEKTIFDKMELAIRNNLGPTMQERIDYTEKQNQIIAAADWP